MFLSLSFAQVYCFCIFSGLAVWPVRSLVLSLLFGQAGKQTGKLAGIELPVFDIQA